MSAEFIPDNYRKPIDPSKLLEQTTTYLTQRGKDLDPSTIQVIIDRYAKAPGIITLYVPQLVVNDALAIACGRESLDQLPNIISPQTNLPQPSP